MTVARVGADVIAIDYGRIPRPPKGTDPMSTSTPTVALYIRMPLALRERLDAEIAHSAWRASLADTVISLLRAALDARDAARTTTTTTTKKKAVRK